MSSVSEPLVVLSARSGNGDDITDESRRSVAEPNINPAGMPTASGENRQPVWLTPADESEDAGRGSAVTRIGHDVAEVGVRRRNVSNPASHQVSPQVHMVLVKVCP